jgi:hypothetical protein
MQRGLDNATGTKSFPVHKDVTIPIDVARAASAVAKHLRDEHFDPETLISRGVYGRSLYGVLPESGDTSLFDSLDAGNGDAMYCVWRRKTITH